VTGTVDFVQPVKAITPDQMDGVYDLVIYLAKQTYNDTAIPQIKAHIGENSTVCVCQNGIPEYAVSAAIGEERVVGAPVGWGATFTLLLAACFLAIFFMGMTYKEEQYLVKKEMKD
jgi:2-dehydropantoate 2-reductase